MAFVNEYITEEDAKKYTLEAIDQKFIVGGTRSRQWTADVGRRIFLRLVSRGREELSHTSTWILFWHGDLVVVGLDLIGTSGGRAQPSSAHYRMRSLEIPAHLADRRDEILADLKEALTAYKDGGVYATATSFTMTLDV